MQTENMSVAVVFFAVLVVSCVTPGNLAARKVGAAEECVRTRYNAQRAYHDSYGLYVAQEESLGILEPSGSGCDSRCECRVSTSGVTAIIVAAKCDMDEDGVFAYYGIVNMPKDPDKRIKGPFGRCNRAEAYNPKTGEPDFSPCDAESGNTVF